MKDDKYPKLALLQFLTDGLVVLFDGICAELLVCWLGNQRMDTQINNFKQMYENIQGNLSPLFSLFCSMLI